ncbi:MAG: flagellar capping protein [Gammaproteobacteria bacterium]|nr:MAG: flagellar capping protein [Gammaproteobacteria bacterium]
MANITSIGIGSGVLTSDLIDKLAAAEREPTEKRLDAKEEEINAKLSDMGRIQSALTDLRISSRVLAQPEAVNARTATSSSGSISVTASESAALGSYSIDVTQLATNHSLSSAVVADADTTTLGTGTLDITVNGVTKSITIDNTNNTLQGIANAINGESGLAVSASVLNTGTGYQLLLTSENSGADNAISIAVTDNDGNSTDTNGLSQFRFDATQKNLTENVAAKDLNLTLNGIAITRSSNTVDDLLGGLSFTFTGTTGGPATVQVTQDADQVVERVQDFVDKYNALKEIINEVTDFDLSTGEGGTLLGNSAIRTIETQVRNTLSQPVQGLESAQVRALSELGITSDRTTGLLTLDESTLKSKLAAAPDDVTALFADQGRTDDPQVQFVRAGSKTKPGSYAINITQMATQGSLAGSVALSGSTVIDANNDTFKIKVDGTESGTITLTQNTYSNAALVAEIQAQLDADTTLRNAGKAVTVSLDGSNQLVFTSATYGSSSKVEITSVDTNTAATLGISVGTGTDGLDVAGTINGKAGTGTGQRLEAAEGDDAEGIAVDIVGGTTGNRGKVTYIEGVAERLIDGINGMLTVDGTLTSAMDTFNKQLAQIAEERAKMEDRIDALTTRLQKQFTAADILISNLKSTGDFITQQLDALAGTSSSNQ